MWPKIFFFNFGPHSVVVLNINWSLVLHGVDRGAFLGLPGACGFSGLVGLMVQGDSEAMTHSRYEVSGEMQLLKWL